MVNNSSVITAKVFDQRKRKRRDDGFLGVVNIEMANYPDLELDGHSMFSSFGIAILLFMTS
jgi:E3 ubiquitin-protein ligase NEDD4